MSRASRRARWDMAAAGAEFQPYQLSAVSSWFRLAHPSTAITGSGYSSVHDVLNPSSPATQGTDARRPPNATSSNGLPIVDVTAHVLSIPVIDARNGTTYWGFAGHFRRTGGTFPSRVAMRAVAGSSADKLDTQSASGDGDRLAFHSLNGAGADSVSEIDGASPLNTWQFLTYEFNGDGATDADKCVITVDGVVQTLTFSGAAMPSALVSVTGTIMYLAQQSGGTNPFVGQAGPNWYFFNAKMAGVTQGLLTAPARSSLSTFERPT